MDVIRRYVWTETLKVFLVAVVVTMLLMTLAGGAKEGIKRGLPPALVIQTMPYIVPEMLRFTIPGCLLFAVCSVFGRMSAVNEIVAIKSMGINPMKVVVPVLIMAYLLSITTFLLYDVCATWARPGLKSLLTRSIDEIAYSFLRANGSFSSHGMSIIVKDVQDDRLIQPIVKVESKNDKPGLTLTAEEASLRADDDTGLLEFECRNGELDIDGRGSLSFPDRFHHSLLLNEPKLNPEDHLSPAALATRAVSRQIARENNEIAKLRDELSQTRISSDGRDPEEIAKNIESRQRRLYRLRAEVPRRLANGFGCLCFALIGIPVAMWGRSGDTMSVFFLCFSPILVLYYPLLATGENMAREGLAPELTVWLADAVLLVVGAVLFMRMIRH